MEPRQFYEDNLTRLQQEHSRLLKRKSALGILRFGTIAALIALLYFLWSAGWIYLVSAVIILLFIFTRLIYRDLANRAAFAHLDQLIRINKAELEALYGDQHSFADGAELMPKEHYYAHDIDIFGPASLYQFLNRTSSEMGAARLAHWLLQPAEVAEIIARQEAIKELATQVEWRQHLQAFGNAKKIKIKTLSRLQRWLMEPDSFLGFKPWQWLRYVLPAIILAISAATFFDLLTMNYFYGALFLYAIIAFQVNKFVAPVHEQLSRMVDELDTLSQSIDAIETQAFKTTYLNSLQKEFVAADGKASQQFRQLKKVLDRLDIRYNIVLSAPLNLFLLWNLQQVLDLEKWKHRYNSAIHNWFDALGRFEAINSLSALHFNHPEWTLPLINAQHFSIEATGLGHPLIPPAKRVNNYIDIHHKGSLMLVTGSNMAGKSTYLRSVGVNVVLAMAGAPVCAKTFSLSPVQVISSMRIADNLEESTSTFYAELKKLKTVIDKVNRNEKVFVLLDEILRGTNSLDRHTGSVALVKQLIRKEAAAIIATHDIALADLQKEYPGNIMNFHFDVQVNKEELYFDYKLKPGVCTSMNASILMKKIGIEL